MSKLMICRGWNAILNVHERALPVSFDIAAQILDSLAGSDDRLWPNEF